MKRLIQNRHIWQWVVRWFSWCAILVLFIGPGLACRTAAPAPATAVSTSQLTTHTPQPIITEPENTAVSTPNTQGDQNSTVSLSHEAIIGAMFDPKEIDKYCSQMPSFDIRAITFTLPWSAVEPQKGVFRWERVDKVINQARNCGLTIGLHVLAKSPWATEPVPSGDEYANASMPPLNSDDYYNFMFNLASRYAGKVSRYSIENEAASPANWGSTPDAYAKMLATAYQAVHDADPGAIVLNDGVSSSGLGFLIAMEMRQNGLADKAVSFLNRYYENFAPGRQSGNPIHVNNMADLDALTTNPVGQSVSEWMDMLAANQAYYDAFQIHFYAWPDQLPIVMEWIQEQLRSQGPGRPIEIWELGYGWADAATFEPKTQALAVPKLITEGVGEGASFIIFWRFTNAIEQVGTGVTGLVTESGPRQAATAFQVTATKLNGVTQAQRLDLHPAVTAYRFKKSSGDIYVLWSTEKVQVRLQLDTESVSITNIQGNVSKATPDMITVDASPIFIESP